MRFLHARIQEFLQISGTHAIPGEFFDSISPPPRLGGNGSNGRAFLLYRPV
jgi:hypothetical protein